MNQKSMVLVIDDEKNIREGLRTGLKLEGFDVMTSEDGMDGLEKFRSIGADAVILDLRMPKMGGLDFLSRAQAVDRDVPILVLTGHGGVDEAVESMKRGAYDFFTKPFDMDKLMLVLRRAIDERKKSDRARQLEELVDDKFNLESIIGAGQGLRRVVAVLKQVAPTDASVLITGESGTGKEVIANAIHHNSRRAKGPIIKVHCAALPESLLESELFGHEKGAFTGAIARKKGRFELADGGTIFLDEIGEISPSVQVKLLRVLQEQQFERVGGEETIQVDIRIITATNRDLRTLVEAGKFREDLFYRLNIVNIHVPPLRERTEDIPLFVDYFVKHFAKKHGKAVKAIAPKAQKLIEAWRWPGNVRELQNTIENLVVLCTGETVTEDLLPDNIRNFTGDGSICIDVGLTMDEIEKRAIMSTLAHTAGNKSKAARLLGIGRKTLLRKLEEYGINNDGSETEDEE
jgi:DNA-binding NtrC family response regulator